MYFVRKDWGNEVGFLVSIFCGELTTRETSHTDPTYVTHDVVHYAVGNMPGAVPNTSTYALTNATLPYQLELATLGARGAAEKSPAMRLGVNTAQGSVCNEIVARDLGKEYVDPLVALS